MASNREERLQMRQRGAASRQIKQVDFGFSFGLDPAPAELSQPASQPADNVGIATGPPALSRPSAPQGTQPSAVFAGRSDAISPGHSVVRRTPGGSRNALPERPSTFDIPPDESDYTRTSKRRKIGSRPSFGRDSSRRETQDSQVIQNGTKTTAATSPPEGSLQKTSTTTTEQDGPQLPKGPSGPASTLPGDALSPQLPADKPSDASTGQQKSPLRRKDVRGVTGIDSQKEDKSQRGRRSSEDKTSPSRGVANANPSGRKAQQPPSQDAPPENQLGSVPKSNRILGRDERQSRSPASFPVDEKDSGQGRSGPAKRKSTSRTSPKQQEAKKQRTRNDKEPSLEVPAAESMDSARSDKTNDAPEDSTLSRKQKETLKSEKRAGRVERKASHATEPIAKTSPPVRRGKRKLKEIDQAQTEEEEQESEPERQPAGKGKGKDKGKQKQPRLAQTSEEDQEPVSQSISQGKRKSKGPKQDQDSEPQPTGKGKRRQRRAEHTQIREPEPRSEDEPGQDNESESSASHSPRDSPKPGNGRVQPGESGPQDGTMETSSRATRKPRQPRGETVPVTVHRLVNVRSLTGVPQPEGGEGSSNDEESADELATTRKTKLPSRGGVNAADVLGQICRETLEKTLDTLKNGITNETNAARRAEWTRKKKAVEAFGSELEGRLFELSEMLDSNFVLGVKLKKAKREMMDMRSRLYQIRKEREGVALQMDSVRRKHSEEENTRMARTTINNSLHSLDLALERSRKPDADSSASPSPTAGLEFMLRSVAETVSSRAPGAQGGLLNQIKLFNVQLEAIARNLES